MRIVVCIKQVPVVSAMQFEPASKTLKREGVPLEVSSFDLRAVSKAVALAQGDGDEVVVLTMGPPQARQALEQCLALGAHRGVHLSDRGFAGADTLATARALAAAIRREPYDLVLCGRHSVDAETGQVGPEIAELLGIPQATVARTLSIDPVTNRLQVEREVDSGFETVALALPALVSAAEDLAPERFATRAEREQAKAKPITTLTVADLDVDPIQLGASGSPTWVAGLEVLENTRLGQVLGGDDIEAAVDELVRRLLDHGLFGEWQVEREGRAPGPATVARSGANDVWVVTELLNARLRPVTFELLGKGRDLATRLHGRLQAVLCGFGAAHLADELAQHGADQILLADDVRLARYDTDQYTAVLTEAIRSRQPGIVLMASTATGRDWAPRVAARLGLGLTGDCIDLGLDGEGRLVQYKPAFGGMIVAPILSRTRPEMATIRPGVLDAGDRDPSRAAVIERLSVPDIGPPRVTVLAQTDLAETATDLDHAKVVIGIGHGVGGKEQLDSLRPLVTVLDGAICATRDVTDAGWLPRQLQVGLTGRSVAPDLYLAIAIRGAMEHMVGVRRAGVIVAINNNPKAPVFKQADYGIVGDYQQVVPLLTARLERVRAR